MRRVPVILCLLVTVGISSVRTCRADILHFVDGTKVEGDITDQGDRYKVRLPSGITMTYPKQMVVRVEKSESSAGAYKDRKKDVAPDDAKGLLELARWCLETNLKTEAEQAYRAAMAVASPYHRDAKRELAGMLDEAKRYLEAFVLYRSLGAECSSQMQAARKKLGDQRAASYRSAIESMQKDQYREAVAELRRAYKVTPPDDGDGTSGVSERDVLEKLIEARNGLAEYVGRMRISLEPCAGCSATGIVACTPCGGNGQVKRWAQVLTRNGPRMQEKSYKCDQCGGEGRVRCSSCSGVSVNVKDMRPMPRSTLRALADKAFPNIRVSIETALKRLHKWVPTHLIAIDDSAPPYADSHTLRGSITSVPPADSDLIKLREAWQGSNPYQRANFLANYGIELVRNVSAIPQGTYNKPELASLDSLADAQLAEAVVLSAFPDDSNELAVRVRGVWKGADAKDGAMPYQLIDLNTGADHTLRPFVWQEKAREAHAVVGKELDFSGLTARSTQYPYAEIASAVAERRRGDRVELLGRFYYESAPIHRWCLEVWGISARPSEEIEKAVSLLSRTVTFHFKDTPLDAAIEMLAELTGVPIEIDIPQNLGMEVTSRMRDVTLGVALSEMLKTIQLYWAPTADCKRIVISAKQSAEDRANVEHILRLLSR
jgi:hypothetical protein